MFGNSLLTCPRCHFQFWTKRESPKPCPNCGFDLPAVQKPPLPPKSPEQMIRTNKRMLSEMSSLLGAEYECTYKESERQEDTPWEWSSERSSSPEEKYEHIDEEFERQIRRENEIEYTWSRLGKDETMRDILYDYTGFDYGVDCEANEPYDYSGLSYEIDWKFEE